MIFYIYENLHVLESHTLHTNYLFVNRLNLQSSSSVVLWWDSLRPSISLSKTKGSWTKSRKYFCEGRSKRRMKLKKVTPAFRAHLLFSKRTDWGISSSVQASSHLSCLYLEDKIGVLDPIAGTALDTHQAFNGTLKTAPQQENWTGKGPAPTRTASQQWTVLHCHQGRWHAATSRSNKPKKPVY